MIWLRINTLALPILLMSQTGVVSQDVHVKQITINKTTYLKDGSKNFTKVEKLYDSVGNKIEEIEYGRGNKLKKREAYEYDGSNSLVFKNECQVEPMNCVKTFIYINDKVHRTISFDQEQNIIYYLREWFDHNGRCVRSENLKSEDTTKVESHWLFEHDPEGKLIKSVWYFNEKPLNEVVHRYNEGGHLAERLELSEGTAPRLEEVKYLDSVRIHRISFIEHNRTVLNMIDSVRLDEQLLKRTFYSPTKRILKELTYVYDYFASKQVKRCEEYENGHLKSVTNYCYEYY